ncbi:MAG: hypothetical protein GY953_13760 [bacterium]|nr:hypothetical protein [bacterium]
MAEATEFIETEIPADALILTESETRLLLSFYGYPRGRYVRSTPFHEVGPIFGHSHVVYRWTYWEPVEDLRSDLESLKQAYGDALPDEVWVIDGGFSASLSRKAEAIVDDFSGTLVGDFGGAVFIFRLPLRPPNE